MHVLPEVEALQEDPVPAMRREISELRKALRASQLRLRRSAMQGTRQMMALNAELQRLQTICTAQARHLERFGSGAVVVDLGRKLMLLTEANARLLEDSRRAAMLERVLAMTDAERKRVVQERDALASELNRFRHDALLGGTFFSRGDHVPFAI